MPKQTTKLPFLTMKTTKVISDFVMDSTVRFMWPREDLSGLIFQIQFAGHEFVGPRYYVHRENFNSFLLAYTPRGHTNILLDKENFCAGSNTLIFYDCTRPFTSTTDWPVYPDLFSAELYYLHLHPNDLVKRFCSLLTHDGPVIRLGDDDGGFRNLVEEVLRATEKGKPDETYFSYRIYEFLCRLKERMQSVTVSSPQAVKTVKRFIAKNFTEKITVKDCARAVHLSPNHIESLFSEVVGVPIATYIANMRFHKSAELLVNTDMSLSQISEVVGLTDSRTLIRLCKKKTGITPLAYRKSKRVKGE